MTIFAELCFLSLVILVSWGSLECSRYTEPLMATKEGDIIIGGIFPVHESVNFREDSDGRPSARNCTRFSVPRMLQALMLVEAVETINNSSLLGNLTLGYRIVDSCSDVTTAVAVTQKFLDVQSSDCPQKGGNRTGQNNSNSSPSRPADVVIGGYHSEISIAVARLLSINQIPQISYGSTTGILSDKSRFPHFMRTVPEDRHQVQAIVDILVSHNWTWVGLVTTDGDYGRYAARRFQEQAQKSNICIAFKTELPDILDDSDLKQEINKTIQEIEKDPKIGVIVSFAKPDHMMYIVRMLTPNTTGRIWIASDNWASSKRVIENATLSDIGVVIGVTLKSANTSDFERYLQGLDPNLAAHQNTMLRQYLQTEGKNKNLTQLREMLKKSVYPYTVFSVRLAVRAIARAVADLCANRDCREGKNFEPWELKTALRNTKFEWKPNGHQYKFDEHGDLNTGYDIILWRQNKDHVDMQDIVASYSIEFGNISFVKEGNMKVSREVGNMTSSCSNWSSCRPGYVKFIPEGKPKCCFTCIKCRNNTFSNDTNMVECLSCEENQWSSEGSTRCLDKRVIFFSWKESFGIVLLSFAALGVILTLVVLVLFLAQWSTPVVRASVGPISLLLLISLLGTFTSTVLFVGEPSNHQCKARQVLFGISFTLCISCILVKSLRILLAFEFDPRAKQVLDRLHQPYLTIATCMAFQVAICTAWLIIKPPKVDQEDFGQDQILLKCNEGEFIFFGLMLAYIGLLSLIGFVIAFKGRKLPDCYNEAKFITFGLLIYLICWVMFGPIYTYGNAGKFLPAVEMIVILFSAYGILCTLFLPKCYIILFKKESNTREAFHQNVRDYNHRRPLEPPSISLSDSSNSEEKDLCTMHSSSSQASLVPRMSSDGCVSPVSGISTAQLTLDSPASTPAAPFMVNRKKKALARCATIH